MVGFISERSLNALTDGASLGPYRVALPSEITRSGMPEVFEVFIFKKFKGGYKLQWERSGKPRLPELKSEIQLKLKAATKNSDTYLTKGFNDHPSHDGMVVGSVNRFLEILKSNRIAFSVD